MVPFSHYLELQIYLRLQIDKGIDQSHHRSYRWTGYCVTCEKGMANKKGYRDHHCVVKEIALFEEDDDGFQEKQNWDNKDHSTKNIPISSNQVIGVYLY